MKTSHCEEDPKGPSSCGFRGGGKSNQDSTKKKKHAKKLGGHLISKKINSAGRHLLKLTES